MASGSNSFIANVPKLKGRENYSEWAFAAENLLVLEGKQIYVKTEGVGEDSTEDAIAKAKLILTIDPLLYVHVKDAKTTKQLWQKLQQMFDDAGFSRRNKKDDWHLDSGASVHITSNVNNIRNPSENTSIREITAANNGVMSVLCSGDVDIVTITSKCRYNITVKDVLCEFEIEIWLKSKFKYTCGCSFNYIKE